MRCWCFGNNKVPNLQVGQQQIAMLFSHALWQTRKNLSVFLRRWLEQFFPRALFGGGIGKSNFTTIISKCPLLKCHCFLKWDNRHTLWTGFQREVLLLQYIHTNKRYVIEIATIWEDMTYLKGLPAAIFKKVRKGDFRPPPTYPLPVRGRIENSSIMI